MNEPILPPIIEQRLQELLSRHEGFARLLPKRQRSAPATLIPVREKGSSVQSILDKHSVPPSPQLAEALEELLESRTHLLLLRSQDDNPPAAEEFLYGRALSSNPILNGLFRIFAYAEYEFCRTDLPHKSHEERLTGHLLSKMYSGLNFSVQAIEHAAESLYGVRIPIDFAYHDLSINGREAVTGSDFGITLHIRLPHTPEFVTSVAFQAKVLDRHKAYLPLKQAKSQVHFASGAGAFTCFYDIGTDNPLPPAVFPTEYVAAKATRTQKSYRVDRTNIEAEAIPLSLFLLQLIRQKESDPVGYRTTSLFQAKSFMLRGAGDHGDNIPYFGPSRVFTLSIGGTDSQDITDLTKLYNPQETAPRRHEENNNE